MRRELREPRKTSICGAINMRLLRLQLPRQCDATSARLQASLAEIAPRHDCRICEQVNFYSAESVCEHAASNAKFSITAEGLYEQLAHGNRKEIDMLLLIILILLIFGFGYGGYRVGPGWGYYGGGGISLLLTIVVILLLLKVI
jgi:hypothetical protein